MNQPKPETRIERAIAFLENSAEDVRLEDVAAHVGMSPFHFARLFATAMGISPIAYQRRFRLERAAIELTAMPQKPLVEIAFDAGFASQQSFTRAFRQTFGRSPGMQRRAKVVHIPSRPYAPLEAQKGHLVRPEPALVEGDPMQLAGVLVRVGEQSDKRPRDAWSALDAVLPIEQGPMGRSFGVCWPAPGDGYDYMAAVELPTGTAMPEGLVRRHVDAQRYVVFHQQFSVEGFAAELKRGLEEIWAVHLPASGYEPSGGPELEIYADEFIAGVTEGEMAYWIPVL